MFSSSRSESSLQLWRLPDFPKECEWERLMIPWHYFHDLNYAKQRNLIGQVVVKKDVQES